MPSAVEHVRLPLCEGAEAEKKSRLGQFFTSAKIAAFMAGLFPATGGVCRLLDAGAGAGALSTAFLERWRRRDCPLDRVELDAFEIDVSLHPHLIRTLSEFRSGGLDFVVHGEDFIHAAVDRLGGRLFAGPFPGYTHAILNPPYKKMNSHSPHRLALRRVGIETVNLYSAFVALAVALAAPGGQVVAIVPRSFCNGPYYRSFRDFILARAAIRRMHLFESRSRAFKDDGVLQENIIIHLERGGRQEAVTVSTSTDDGFTDLVSHEHSFDRIVLPGDSERFIHVPASPRQDGVESSPMIRCSLEELGVKVSTGPVVDFRLKSHLRDQRGPHDVPLLYPGHFSGHGVTWPAGAAKKPNAIERNGETEKWLYPTGFYCVVRRFSAKEERRRIVASVVDPKVFEQATVLGFENHLNLFHENKRGLSPALAHGLALFLNSTAVDESFRRFNGHTQVNATDLRRMKYPCRDVLSDLGEWAMRRKMLTQTMIDGRMAGLLS